MSELKAVVAVYHVSDRMKYMKYWSKLGVFWGTIWGLISGTVFVAVAGTGPVLVAGSLVTSIIAALQGGVVIGALSAIGAGLYCLRIPKDSSIQSETNLSASRFVLLGHSSKTEIARVRNILKTTRSVTLDLCSLSRNEPWQDHVLPKPR
jgi:hypothetical protein